MQNEITPVQRIKDVMGGLAQAILGQNELGVSGLERKYELQSIATRLHDDLTRSDVKRDISEDDRVFDTLVRYEHIVDVALISKEVDISKLSDEKTGEKLRKNYFNKVREYSYNSIIKLGAAVATEIKKGDSGDQEFIELAKEALLQATNNCPTEYKKYAIEALALYSGVSIKKTLVELVNHPENSISTAARESILKLLATESRDTATADSSTLKETEFPNISSIERRYIDMIMGAVDTVLNGEHKTGVWRVAVRTLATSGTSIPDSIKGKIDLHNSRLIRRNVENALLHAYLYGSQIEQVEAGSGLKKIGSVSVIDALKEIVKHEREDNILSPLGKRTLQLLQIIERERYGTITPPPAPSQRKQLARITN